MFDEASAVLLFSKGEEEGRQGQSEPIDPTENFVVDNLTEAGIAEADMAAKDSFDGGGQKGPWSRLFRQIIMESPDVEADEMLDFRAMANSTGGAMKKKFSPDVYMAFVIAAICLIVLVLILYACYKTVKILKFSEGGTVSDEIVHQTTASNNGDNDTTNGFMHVPAAFSTSNLRNTRWTKSEDDPPPYDEFPPSYNEAIKLEDIAKIAKAEIEGETSEPQASTSLQPESGITRTGESTGNSHSPKPPNRDETDNKKISLKERFMVMAHFV